MVVVVVWLCGCVVVVTRLGASQGSSPAAVCPFKLADIDDSRPANNCLWSGLIMSSLEVFATGSEEVLSRPCVDCSLVTGCFCDHCRAADRLPGEVWADNQMTPLCTHCDRKHGACHFCRGQIWCVPPPSTQAKRTTS